MVDLRLSLFILASHLNGAHGDAGESDKACDTPACIKPGDLWSGRYSDPEGVEITIKSSGQTLIASSSEWDLKGVIRPDGFTASLAGLQGIKVPSTATGDVLWNNGVRWVYTRAPAQAPAARTSAAQAPWPRVPWEGVYVDNHAAEITVERHCDDISAKTAKWKADGHVSGEQIFILGLSGRAQAGRAPNEFVIGCKSGRSVALGAYCAACKETDNDHTRRIISRIR